MDSVIINGKKYIIATALILCKCVGLFEATTLYRSQKGAYFTITENVYKETTATVLSETEAVEFMNAHPLGINTENYVKIFGEPIEG